MPQTMILQGGREELGCYRYRSELQKRGGGATWPGAGIQTEAARPHGPHGARHTTRNGTVAPDTRGSMARVSRASSLGPRSSVPRSSVPRSAMVAPARSTKRPARSAMQTGRGVHCRSLHAGRAEPRRGAGSALGVQQRRPGGDRDRGRAPPATATRPPRHPARACGAPSGIDSTS